MPYEGSAKKKRIILSTHRKNNVQVAAQPRQPADSKISELREFREDGEDQSIAINCASINNSLEIFDQDPKYRHFQFLDNEEDRSEPFQSKEKSRVEQLQTVPSTTNMHKKVKNPHKANKCQEVSKIATTISLGSLHVSTRACVKKLARSPTRRFIDLTLKRDFKRLSHQSSDSFLLNTDKSCLTRSNIFEAGRSILSSISVNSVQFSVGRAPSQRKKALTITCHKYEGEKGKKTKSEGISKCNSIKLFGKFI